MNPLYLAPIVLGALGIVFGAILAFASKVFAVEKDPREEEIGGILPGANCGGCGFPGCSGYAAAVVKGIAPVTACTPGGADLAAKIGEIMGVEAVMGARRVAEVLCSGHGCDKLRYDYEGLTDCRAMSRVSAGGMMCEFGCLGGGTCVEYCQFNAIHVVNGVAVVDPDACVACDACVAVCPRKIIQVVPLKTKRHVAVHCHSKAKGPVVRKACDDGCIGCGLCVKSCPKEGAITVENNLATINYDICIGCGICAQNCPRKTINVDGVVPAPKPKKEAAPAAAKPAVDPAAAAAAKQAAAEKVAADMPAISAEDVLAAAETAGTDVVAAAQETAAAELTSPAQKLEKAKEAGGSAIADGKSAAPIGRGLDTPAEMMQKKAERPAQKKINDPK